MTRKSTGSIFISNLASFIFGVLMGITVTLLAPQIVSPLENMLSRNASSESDKVYTHDRYVSPFFDNPEWRSLPQDSGSRDDFKRGSDFRCQQNSETFLTPQKPDIGTISGILTLRFDTQDQTVSVGALTGLEYHKSGNTVKFHHSPNYLEKYQFIDSYRFDTFIGKLEQEVRISITGTVSSPTDTGGYTLVYKSTYDCIKK